MIHISDLKKTEQFVAILKNIKSFTNDILIQLQEDRFYIQGMDNAHVSMFEVVLCKSWFDTYDVKQPRVAGLNTETLSKILSSKQPSHSIKMECKENKFIISFQHEPPEEKTNSSDNVNGKGTGKGTGKGKSKGKGKGNAKAKGKDNTKSKKSYTLNVIDIDMETMGIPDQEYNVEFECHTKLFKTSIDDVGMFGDSIRLSCTEDNILLNCNNDMCNSEVTLFTDQVKYYLLEDTIATFNISYIQMFMQFYKLSDYIWVHFTKDMPLMVTYNLDHPGNTGDDYSIGEEGEEGEEEGDDDDGGLPHCENFVRFFLAPKIDDDYDVDGDE